MRLSELIADADVTALCADPGAEISAIVSDSRRVVPGALFLCLRGTRTDGHRFLADAAARGAAAAVIDEAEVGRSADLPVVCVRDTRAAAARIWNRFYGRPDEGMCVAAVTGTNGKTSVSWMLRAILAAAGRRVGMIGTVRCLCGEEEIPLGILSASYRRPRACAVLLVRADKERREFTVTVFPSLTRVLTASGNQTLDNLYNLYGRDYIVSKASAMTGLPIDYSLMINITEVSDVVAELGGFSMYISRDLYYNGSVSTSVRPTGEEEQLLPKLYSIGSNNVDGPGAVALLMNEEYASGADVAAHNSVLITMFTEIMNKLTAMEGAAATAFYEKLCEDALIDTNFSPTEFVDRLELIFAWRDETFHRTSLEYPGRFVPATPEETAYYEPNTPAGVALFRNYRRILTENKAA